MKLEDEIKQLKFTSPEQKLAVNLFYSANWLNGFYADFFRDTDLTTQQFNVLRILRGQHPRHCTLKEVKERVIDRMSDVSRIVDKLVAKEFVERKTCPGDRRSVHLLITQSGLKLLKKLDTIDEQVKAVFSHLNKSEIIELNRLLDKMRG